ncbi:MAG: hypothetical protein K8W52_32610 [Deltaproteobacteria bacterium]|nr:hypothetical protein [Deltaproteobacteria bacterium]
MAAPRASSSSARVRAAREALAGLARSGGPGDGAILDEALATLDQATVIEAAARIADHGIAGRDAALIAAYRALAGARASADPACLAKAAILAALDAVDHGDPELFAAAARHVQLERARGASRDTAAPVRVRGVLGVARLGHVDAMAIFGACLADRDAEVRHAAARAIAHRGHRDGAGLLLLKLGVGDEVAGIPVECLRGLFALAPDLAEPRARAMLDDGDPRVRQVALHALGTAPDDRAIAVLADGLHGAAVAADRDEIIEALGLSRRAAARALLLELVASDRTSDAHAALTALAIHRDDPRVVAEVRAATAEAPELADRVAQLFGR